MIILEDKIDHIIDNVYIGSLNAVRHYLYDNAQEKLGIVSIGDFPNPIWSRYKNIDHVHLGGLSDFDTRRFAKVLEPGIKTIHHYNSNHDKCIVHCYAGINRSASLVIGWLMTKKGMNFSSALSHVESKRNIAPHPNLTVVLKNI